MSILLKSHTELVFYNVPFYILTFFFLLCTRSLINLVLIDIEQLMYYL